MTARGKSKRRRSSAYRDWSVDEISPRERLAARFRAEWIALEGRLMRLSMREEITIEEMAVEIRHFRERCEAQLGVSDPWDDLESA